MQNSCGSTLLPPNPPRGGEKRLFLGLGMSLFLRFFAQESISAHGTSEQPDMACAPPVVAQPSRAWWRGESAQHCCGVVAASGNGGGCEGNQSALVSVSAWSPRGQSPRWAVSPPRCAHTSAPTSRYQSLCRSAFQGTAWRGDCPEEGEAGVEATLASCTAAGQSLSQTASGVHRTSCPLPGSRCRSP